MRSRIYNFESDEIVVHWDYHRCIHVEACIRALPSVFCRDQRPWIQPEQGSANAIVTACEVCPTGALHYTRKDGGGAEETPARNEIVVSQDGPLYVKGDVHIVDESGEPLLEETRVALCRCGHSRNKPLCDGHHEKAAFRHDGALTEAHLSGGVGGESEGGELTIRAVDPGPLMIKGSAERRQPRGGLSVPSESRRLKLSTIGRPIDLSFPTNRAILFLSLLALIAGVILGLTRGDPWAASLLNGLQWAGSAFLAWAIARETDPDRWHSAFFAAAGALVSVILLGPPSFLFLFWFLIALRYINRSTGEPPGALDFVALYGVKLWLGYSAHWTIPLLTFPTMFFAGIERFPRWLRVGLPLALPAAAVILGFTRGWHFAVPAWGLWELLGLLVIALAIIPVIVSYRVVRSVGDRTGAPLSPHRIQWALGWAVAAALILTLSGTASLQDLIPLWAAFAGTALGWAAERIANFTTSPNQE